MKITKSELKQIIKEELQTLMNEEGPDLRVLEMECRQGNAAACAELGQLEQEAKKKAQSGLEEEKKDDDFLGDVKSTGEWTDYTIGELEKKKAALMKKKKRTADEVKTVRQLNFAINAKQGDYKKK